MRPTPTFSPTHYRTRSDTGASVTQHLLSPDHLVSPRERSPSFVSGVSSMDHASVGESGDEGARERER